MSPAEDRSAERLRAAFDEMIDGFRRARDAIDAPELTPPPGTARNLADGYRYLMGSLVSGLSRAVVEDTEYPVFRPAIPPHCKSTWDNADALYLSAPIDPNRYYIIRAEPNDTRHWTGEPEVTGPRAPCYAIFSTSSRYTGDSGSIGELSPDLAAALGVDFDIAHPATMSTGHVASNDIILGRDGTLEILVGPSRPADFEGNFLPTRRLVDGVEHTAAHVVCRQLFADWEHELPFTVTITVRDESVPVTRPSPTVDRTAATLSRAGELAANQMRFWNEYFSVLLNGYGDSPLPLPTGFLAPNQLKAPSSPVGVGAAQETNVYSGGTYDLGPDEALVITQTVPDQPLIYSGINLSNFWGESLDYANRLTSMNHAQVTRVGPTELIFVIAHEDPGWPNWLDTTGLPQGFITQRWIYPGAPDDLPTVSTEVVAWETLRSMLPDHHPVTAEQRRTQLAVRAAHSQQRFRF